MARQRTAASYAKDIKSILEESGLFSKRLIFGIDELSRLMVRRDQIDIELSNRSSLIDITTSTRGNDKMAVTPLLAERVRISGKILDHSRSLGLNYDTNPNKTEREQNTTDNLVEFLSNVND